MVIDRKVVLTGSMNWTAIAARNSDDINLISSEAVATAYTAHWQNRLVASDAVRPARSLVPQPRDGWAQVGIRAEMKPDQHDRLEARGDLSKPGEFLLGTLQPPEIVGEVAINRCWRRSGVSGGEAWTDVHVRLSTGPRRALRNPLWYAVQWPRRRPQTR
jgi:hypothetical protein